METRRKHRRRGRRRRKRTGKILILGTAVLVIAGLVFGGFMLLKNILPAAGEKTEEPKTPEELLCYYMAEIEQDKYEEMYDMLEPQSQESISREAFGRAEPKYLSGNRRRRKSVWRLPRSRRAAARRQPFSTIPV